MDGDDCDDGWSLDEQAPLCYTLGIRPTPRRFRPRMVATLNEMDLDRVRAAYDEVRAAPRLVFPPTKRRRIDGRRTEIALPSLGLEPLSIAFSFLHPVELTSSLKRLVRRPGPQRWKLSTLVPRKTEEYGSADYRMAVLLEEGELSFRGNWGLVLEPKEIEKWWLAGYSLQTCPAGSLRDFLQKRYIFVREQCKDYPFPSDCQCRGVNEQWSQLFPDRPLRCRRCKEFDLALDCMDLSMVCIAAEIEADRDEALWIAQWEEEHGPVE